MSFLVCIFLCLHIIHVQGPLCISLLKANVWKLFIAADVKNLGLWINVSF